MEPDKMTETVQQANEISFEVEELATTGAVAANCSGTVGTGSSAGCPSTAATIGTAGSF
ncbi:thiocillin family RiPP [uncultured Corynebacterium sp.]|uniref:thiocillin family RiPP n=1 Tax=uncultured Corynebacterium sp. TaxID=159447 RepID=UPI0025D72926|nr:thiocillin family RiPP [uncultured Corynebacterium sp.]